MRLVACFIFIVAGSVIGTGIVSAQQIDVERWLDTRIGHAPYSFHYDISVYTQEDVENQDTNLQLTEQEARFSAPVWQNQRHELTLYARGELQDIDTGAILPKEGVPLPGDLWELRFGAFYRNLARNNWLWGVSASFGSASDKPFESVNELDGSATGFLRIPHREKNAWVFFLNFATNREFLPFIPLPGFGYWWEPNDTFRALIGVPVVSITYEPVKPLRLHVNYFPARNVYFNASYQVIKRLSLFSEFVWRNERYLRAGREDNDDRLFYYEKRVDGGVSIELYKNISLQLTGGYAFDRFYYEGDDYDDRNDNRISVGNGYFGQGAMSLRF